MRSPSTRPTAGSSPTIVPHLTVTHRPDAPIDAITAAVGAHLPVAAAASRVEVWQEGVDDRWSTRASFPLNGARR